MFNLEFIPITSENYDFLISIDSISKRSVQVFLNVLRSEEFKIEAEKTLKGIKVSDVTGKIIYEPSKTY